MTVLPIIERELRARARSRATYWTRFAVALVGMLFCLPQLIAPGAFGGTVATGKGVFAGMVWAGFVLCCGCCLLTADVVSSERREGTLGLLLLTRVNRLDVLLGKLGSVGLTSLAVLVVLLPMLMVPVLAGGVMAGEALRKGVGLVNTLFFALAAGLFASTLTKERHKAIGWALGLVVAMVIVPSVLDMGVRAKSFPAVFGLVSPAFVIIWERSQSLSSWVISLATVQALAWLLLLGAGAGLRRAMRQESGAAASAQLRGLERRSPTRRGSLVSEGGGFARNRSQDRAGSETGAPISEIGSAAASGTVGAPVRKPWRPFETGASTVEWLVCRQPGINAAIWTAIGVMILYLFISGWLFRFRGGWGLFWYGAMLLPWLAIALFEGTLLAWATTRFFAQARQSGELELLRTTPLGAEAIIWGQWRALKRRFRWPVIVWSAAMMLRSLWTLAFRPRGTPDWTIYDTCALLLSLGHVLLEMGATCWTGMWFGLHARRPAAAIAWTVGWTRGVPFLMTILGQILVGILVGIFRLSAIPLARLYFMLPQVVTLFFFLWLIRRSKRQLFEHLAGAESAKSDHTRLARPLSQP